MALEDGEGMNKLLDFLCTLLEKLHIIDCRSLENLDGGEEFNA